jgi:hypothetical protein
MYMINLALESSLPRLGDLGGTFDRATATPPAVSSSPHRCRRELLAPKEGGSRALASIGDEAGRG